MIRAIFWKEWHEHRARYVRYWLTLFAPMILLCIAIGVSTRARLPFADLSNTNVWKYLPLALLEPILLATIFVFAAGYLAVATFSREIEDRSVFFIFEQPVSRTRYVVIKFLNGAIHIVAATCLASLLAPAVVYGLIMLSGNVTSPAAGAALSVVLPCAARMILWASLLSLAAFAASALVSAVLPRWWLAAIGSTLLIIVLGYTTGDFFNFFPPDTTDPISVSANLTTGDAPWVSVSRPLTPGDLAGFGHWQPLPLSTAALMIVILCAATAFLYERKELK